MLPLMLANVALAPIAAAQAVPPAPAPAEEEAEAAPAPPGPTADEASAPSGSTAIVTANKREQSLQSLPVAASVIAGDTIDRAAIRDLQDLATLVPSLRVIPLQGPADTNFTIRGFGNGANNAGIEPSVGLFVDGVYRSHAVAMIGDLPDLDRVEVLRGPQSTLFGKDASAGVIAITTPAPADHFGGHAEVSYGNLNAVVLKGMVTGPISDKLSASLSGSYDRRDGYIHDAATGTSENNRNRWGLRGQLLFRPDPALKIRLIADIGHIDEDCCAAVNIRPSAATAAVQAVGGAVNPANAPFADTTYTNRPSTNAIHDGGVSGQVEYALGPLRITSITAWRQTHTASDSDPDYTSADLFGANSQNQRITTITQELRAGTQWDGPLNAVLGGFYMHERIGQDNRLAYGADARDYADALLGQGGYSLAQLESGLGAAGGSFFGAGQGLNEAYHLSDDSFSLFAQVEFKLKEHLTLTGGVGYTHDAKSFSANDVSNDVFSAIVLPPSLAALRAYQFMPPFLNLPNGVEPGKVSDGHVSFTARANYAVSEKVNAYLSYASGWKAASVNLSRGSRPLAGDLPAIAAMGLGLPNLTSGSRFAAPEDSRAWEAGLKGDWGLVTLDLAVFQQAIKGFQSGIFTGNGFDLANAGKQSAWGFEFEGTAHPAPPLTLSLAVAYLDAKYDSFPDSALGDLSGTRPAGVSPLSATFGAAWNQPLGHGNRLILSGSYHYEAPYQLVDGLPGLVKRDPATGRIIDASAAIQAARQLKQQVNQIDAALTLVTAKGLSLSAWGRNLGNSRYLLQMFDSPAQPGSISAYPNQPRTYGVTARIKW